MSFTNSTEVMTEQPQDIDNGIHPYRLNLLDSQKNIQNKTGTFSDSATSLDSNVRKENINYFQSGPSSDHDIKIHGNIGQPAVSIKQNKDSSPMVSALSLDSTSLCTSDDKAQLRKARTKSVDLLHMYQLSNTEGAHLTATTESVANLSHQMISRYFDEDNGSALYPRLKTIEMYRENVKKFKDATVLFEYAQYMLQTALTIEETNIVIDQDGAISSPDNAITQSDLKKQFLKEAHHYLKKLSLKGYADSQYLLADAYSSGAFGEVENKESFSLFQAAAKHGHIESAYRVAYCFENGLGTTRNSRKAVDFLKLAASRNHPSSMYKLGLYSFHGRMGLSNDVNTKQNGIKWLSRAAARANELTSAAPYELANIYRDGFLDIIIPDEKYATELYIQAASLGHIQSSTILGQIYEIGNTAVKNDVSLSIHYYTQAATRGDPVAMVGLCAWYLLGAEPAFEKDESEAFQWVQNAANTGFPKAQFTLGYFYEKGKGCEKDLERAVKWYEKAAINNDPRALNKMKSISPKSDEFRNQNKVYSHKENKSVNTINLFSLDDDTNGEGQFKIGAPQNSTSSGSQIMNKSEYFSGSMDLSSSVNTPIVTLSDSSPSNLFIGEANKDTYTPSNISGTFSLGNKLSSVNKTRKFGINTNKSTKDKKNKNCVVM